MSGPPVAFEGSIPENYDRYLGPMFFEPYAEDLVGRLSVSEKRVGARTGLWNRHRHAQAADRLPLAERLTATDLSEADDRICAGQIQPGRTGKVATRRMRATCLFRPAPSTL